MSDEVEEKSMLERIKTLIKAMRERPGEDKASAGKRFSQGVADELPDEVMPHDALDRQKQKLKKIDAMFEEK